MIALIDSPPPLVEDDYTTEAELSGEGGGAAEAKEGTGADDLDKSKTKKKKKVKAAVKKSPTTLIDKLCVLVENGEDAEVVTFLENCKDKLSLLTAIGSEGHTALGTGVSVNNIFLVDLLLEDGADINQPSKAGDTPLLIALKNVKFDGTTMVNFLLSRGADYSLPDAEGRLPQEFAQNATADYWLKVAENIPPIKDKTPYTKAKLTRLPAIDFGYVVI